MFFGVTRFRCRQRLITGEREKQGLFLEAWFRERWRGLEREETSKHKLEHVLEDHCVWNLTCENFVLLLSFMSLSFVVLAIILYQLR